jgi:hypothetical protein
VAPSDGKKAHTSHYRIPLSLIRPEPPFRFVGLPLP